MKIRHLLPLLLLTAPLITRAATPTTTPAPPLTGDLSLLTTVADALDQNKKDLHNWQTTAQIDYANLHDPDAPEAHSAIEIAFTTDFEHNASRWQFTLQSATLGEDKITPYTSLGLITHQSVYRLQPYNPRNARPFALTLLLEPDKPAQNLPMRDFNQNLHPSAYFLAGDTDMAEDLRLSKQNAPTPSFITGTITQKDDLVIFELTSKSHDLINHWEFSKSHHYHITRRYFKGPDITDEQLATYEEINHIFVPATYKSIRTSATTPPNITTMEITFTHSTVNADLPATTFTPDSLLQPGDVLYDRTKDLTTPYPPPTTTTP